MSSVRSKRIFIEIEILQNTLQLLLKAILFPVKNTPHSKIS